MTYENGVSSYRRFLQGDSTALEELVRTYSDRLVRFACSYVKDATLAEEIMEDAFTALIVSRKNFSEKDNFSAYLYKIVRNKCLDYLRWHRRKVSLEEAERAFSVTDLDGDIVRRERNKALYRCMQSLPEQYREVLYLSYFESCSVEEICAVTGKWKKQVYNLLARAKAALKELLIKEGISSEDV